MSTTVTVHYRVADPKAHTGVVDAPAAEVAAAMPAESPEERAQRLTEKLRGLLKDEIAAHGGSEAFVRWVRGYDEEDAA
ncbi:MAG TPA: hypothetical protein VF392_10395 [Terracidiphilus sp.]